MATLRDLTEDEAKYVIDSGQDPAHYAYEQESGQAVIRPEFKYLTRKPAPIREAGRSAVRGLRDTAARALSMLGGGIRSDTNRARSLARELAGLEPEEGPQLPSLLEQAATAVSGVGEDVLRADPRTPIANTVGEVAGQVGSLVVPGLAGLDRLSKASLAANMLSGAEGVRQDYTRTQAEEGTPVTEDEALQRGAAYLPVSLAEQALFNKVAPFLAPFSGRGTGGRLAGRTPVATAMTELEAAKAGSPAGRLAASLDEGFVEAATKKPLRFSADEALRGAGGEAVDSATAQLMGTGEVDPTQTAIEALAGGATQGSLALGAAVRKSGKDKVAEAKKRFAESQDVAPTTEGPDPNVGLFAQQMARDGMLDPNVPGEVERVAAAPTMAKAQELVERTTSVRAMLAAQAQNKKHDPIAATPVDKVFEQMRSKGIPTDPDMLHQLWEVYDGKPENAEKVEKAARLMADRIAPSMPARREHVAEAALKRVQEAERLDSAIEQLSKKIEDIDKEQQKMLEMPPTGQAGDFALRFSKTKSLDRKNLERERMELLQQKELLVQQGQVAEPAPVLAARVPKTRQLGMGEQGGRPEGPAIPAGAPRPVLQLPAPGQTGTPPVADNPGATLSAIPMRADHGSKSWQNVPRTPEVEAALRGYAEDEQSLPFSGESDVRPGTLDEVQPVPETAAQISQQLALTADPKSTKAATLVTPGSPLGQVPDGLVTAETPHGMVVYNPAKVSAEQVQAASAGPVFDGRILGYGTEPSAEGGSIAVTSTVGGTKGVLSEVVRTPEEAQAAATAQAQAAPGSVQEVGPAEDVLDGRETLDRNMVLVPNPEKLLAGTYTTHAEVELARPKPFGLMPDKEDRLQVPAFLAKIKQVMPKSERAVYEQNGLEDFLHGRSHVSRKELAAWMDENGPKVELRLLRPKQKKKDLETSPEKAAIMDRVLDARQEAAEAKHALETFGVDVRASVFALDNTLTFRDVENNEVLYNTDNGLMTLMSDNGERFPYTPKNSHIKELLDFYHEATIKEDVAYQQLRALPVEEPVANDNKDSTIGVYFVEPRRVEDMEGPVEGLVRIPTPTYLGEKIPADSYTGGRYTYKVLRPGEKYGERKDADSENIIKEVTDGYAVLVFDTGTAAQRLDPQRFSTEEEAKKRLETLYDRDLENPRNRTLWTGGHHNESGHNAVGFFRANVETLPDGRKGLHLFEVQSDWASIDKIRSGADKGKFTTSDGEIHDSFAAAEAHNAKRHPLLPDYNRLVLKAAITHAAKEGLDFVAISDPETAMLTQRHHEAADTVVPVDPQEVYNAYKADDELDLLVQGFGPDWNRGRYVRVSNYGLLRIDKPELNGNTRRATEIAKQLIDAGYGDLKPGDDPKLMPIPQEAGMRRNYGDILPRLLAQLTGSGVVPVEFVGEHQNVREAIPAFGGKRTITANAADLTNVKTALASGKAYTLFGADRVEKPMLKAPEVRYSTIFPPTFENYIKDKIFPTLRRAGVRYDPVSWLNAVTQADISRLVRANPLAGLLARNLDTLYIKRTGRENRMLARLDDMEAAFGKFLDAPAFVKWVHDSLDGRSEDVTALPAGLQDAGRAFRDFIKDFHKEQNDLGIGVMEFVGGRRQYRKAKDIDGYAPMSVAKEVYDAMLNGSPEWAQYKKDWFDHWKSVKGTLDGAAEALQAFSAPFASTRTTGGEPLFSAVRVQAGIGLPKSWRAKSLRDSLQNYIHQWASDLTWGEVMESNPLMRRALGISHDAMGRRVLESDMAVKPNKAEWNAILEAGAKHDAPWLDTIGPNTPLDMVVLGRSPFGSALYHNYTQRPLQTGALGKVGEVSNQIAASMMMQHMSKTRNILQSGLTVLDYALDPETAVPALTGLVDAIIAPGEAIRKAQAAGSQQVDVVRQEAADALADGFYKTLRGFRKYTGLNAMDAYAKALAYNVAEAAVRHQYTTMGPESPLVKEFGPVAGKSPDEVVKQTAATIANRTDPSYDVRSLPAALIPQNRAFLGNMLRLMTWSVGRFNNWYQDVWRPAMRGERFDRLIKSLIIGSLGAAATQELLAFIQDKMPRDLSLGEWAKLSEEQQRKEVAPMVFGYLQAQGAMGILGDIAYAGARTAAGRTPAQDYTRPMIPGLLVARDAVDTTWDFLTYAADERGWDRLDATDLMKYGVEMAKVMQTFRVVMNRGDAWMPERLQREAEAAKKGREERVFEETTGLSARTGERLAPSSLRGRAAAAVSRNPFSLAKELEMRSGDDLQALRPSLEAAAREGQTFRLPRNVQSRAFYRDVETRRGLPLAQQLLERDVQKENERARKGPLVLRLNWLAGQD